LGWVPSESTIRHLLARLDPAILDLLLGGWAWTRLSVIDGRRVLAVDGKTVRGSRTDDRPGAHLVAALDHDTGVVVDQVDAPAKTGEIAAVRRLLGLLDLQGVAVVVTMDALHEQRRNRSLMQVGSTS
jgi:hypothetical protein